MMKTFLLAPLLLVGFTSTASADAQDDCRMKLMNVTNNLPSSPRSSAEAESRLKTARGFWQQGATCAPKFAGLKQLFDSTKAALEKAEQQKAMLVELEGLETEINALAQKLATADEPTYKKLVASSEALNKKIEAFGSKFGKPVLQTERRQLERTIESRAGELAKANVAAGNKAIVDAAITRHGFSPEDAYDQKKIREAFAKAEATDIVVITKAKDVAFQPVIRDHSQGRNMSSDKVKFDVMRFEGNMQLLYARSPLPAEGTPAIVWNAIDDDSVVIVTIDGGRYTTHVSAIEKGVGKPESWPNDVMNDALDPKDIAKLVEIKLLPATILATLTKENDANNKCNEKVWAKAKPQNEAIARANITETTRQNRYAQLQEKMNKQADATCGKHEKAYRKAWNKANETRRAERAETLKVAKARLATLAASR